FQAEDGIRDRNVTGVQTCALPISRSRAVVLDQAAQKGTGAWTVKTALDLGVPVTGIAEATFARSISGGTPQREAARGVLPGEEQIGRASCRERVAVSGASVAAAAK